MELAALQSLALSVAQARSPDTVLSEMVAELGMTEGVALARVWLVEENENTPILRLRASVGFSFTDPELRWTRTDGAHQKFPSPMERSDTSRPRANRYFCKGAQEMGSYNLSGPNWNTSRALPANRSYFEVRSSASSRASAVNASNQENSLGCASLPITPPLPSPMHEPLKNLAEKIQVRAHQNAPALSA